MSKEIEELARKLREFAAARDWDQYHSPKNLAMALSAEAGELLEHFQWLTEEQSRSLPPEKLKAIGEEIADIQIYLVRLADKLCIDIMQSACDKISMNEAKYPADRVRGSARKYTEYSNE